MLPLLHILQYVLHCCRTHSTSQRHKGTTKNSTWPTKLHDRNSKRPTRPCVHCGYAVSGAFQCGTCWGNIHLKCGKSEKFGKSNPRVCKWCYVVPTTAPEQHRPLSNAPVVGPVRLYNSSDERSIRRRLYPCPSCGLIADGQHQCIDCFRHVHQQLDDGYPGGYYVVPVRYYAV